MLVQYTQIASLSPIERDALLASINTMALEGQEFFTFRGKTFKASDVISEKQMASMAAKGPRQTLMG